jgi:hypothetical protein
MPLGFQRLGAIYKAIAGCPKKPDTVGSPGSYGSDKYGREQGKTRASTSKLLMYAPPCQDLQRRAAAARTCLLVVRFVYFVNHEAERRCLRLAWRRCGARHRRATMFARVRGACCQLWHGARMQQIIVEVMSIYLLPCWATRVDFIIEFTVQLIAPRIVGC